MDTYEVPCVPLHPSATTSNSIDFQIFPDLIPFNKMLDHIVMFQLIRGSGPLALDLRAMGNNLRGSLSRLDDETWAVIDKYWNQEPEKRPVAKEPHAF